MSEDQVRIGFDRYLKLEWANYALDLYLSREDPIRCYELLKRYIQDEVKGVETARKAANQLKRLWLNPQDEYQELRDTATSLIEQNGLVDSRILHFGLAINVFPIFMETCRSIGEVAVVQEDVNRKIIVERVTKSFLNPNSTPRVVLRIFQTLLNWGLIESSNDKVKLKELPIVNYQVGEWFLNALICALRKDEVTIREIISTPEKLGVSLPTPREICQVSKKFLMKRSINGEEKIILIK